MNKIFSVIKDGLEEKFGTNIEFITHEVNKIDKEKPRIISKIDVNKIKTTGYA